MGQFQMQGSVAAYDQKEFKKKDGSAARKFFITVEGQEYTGWVNKDHVPLAPGSQVSFTFDQNEFKGKMYNNIDMKTYQVTSLIPGVEPSPAPQTVAVHTQAAPAPVAAAPAAAPVFENNPQAVGLAIKCAAEMLGGDASIEDLERVTKQVMVLQQKLRNWNPSVAEAAAPAASIQEDAQAFANA